MYTSKVFAWKEKNSAIYCRDVNFTSSALAKRIPG
jgi:hypothetical protein